jgi:phosphoglycolate phosphatase-like HAD superfamily hydrolase
MKPERLVMFDVDGTLVENGSAEDNLYAWAMKKWLGVESIETDWSAYRHVTDTGIATELYARVRGQKPSRADLENVAHTFLVGWKKMLLEDPGACTAMEGIHHFLERLHELPGTEIAIATGGWEKTAALKLGHAGIAFSKMAIATANDAISREEIMKLAHDRALENAGVSAFQRVVYFGDGEWDVLTTRKMKFDFIGIDSSGKRPVLGELGARYIFDDFTLVDDLISLICRNP